MAQQVCEKGAACVRTLVRCRAGWEPLVWGGGPAGASLKPVVSRMGAQDGPLARRLLHIRLFVLPLPSAPRRSLQGRVSERRQMRRSLGEMCRDCSCASRSTTTRPRGVRVSIRDPGQEQIGQDESSHGGFRTDRKDQGGAQTGLGSWLMEKEVRVRGRAHPLRGPRGATGLCRHEDCRLLKRKGLLVLRAAASSHDAPAKAGVRNEVRLRGASTAAADYCGGVGVPDTLMRRATVVTAGPDIVHGCIVVCSLYTHTYTTA